MEENVDKIAEEYVNLDNKYGDELRSMASLIIFDYQIAASMVDQIINEQAYFIMEFSIEEKYHKACLITKLRDRCLEYLSNIDFVNVNDLGSSAQILGEHIKRYVGCNRIDAAQDKHKDDMPETIIKKAAIVCRILSQIGEEKSEILLRRFYYLQSVEQIAKELDYSADVLEKKVNKIRKKFMSMYRDNCKVNDIGCSRLNNYEIQYFKLIRDYADRISYFPDYKRAIKYVPYRSVEEYYLIHIFSNLSYIDVASEKDILSFVSADVEEEINLFGEVTINSAEDFFDEYEIEDDKKEKLVVGGVTADKSLIKNILSGVFIVAVLIFLIIEGLQLIGETQSDELRLIKDKGKEHVYSSNSEELGLSFDYYYDIDDGSISVSITQNYYVKNDFSIDITNDVSSCLMDDMEQKKKTTLINGRINENDAQKEYEEGDIKFIYCKKLGIVFVAEYIDDQWHADRVDYTEEITGKKGYDINDEARVTKFKYYQDADCWTANYAYEDGVDIVKFYNDENNLDEVIYENSEMGITVEQWYNPDSAYIEYECKFGDALAVGKGEGVFLANYSTEDDNQYINIYYCFNKNNKYHMDRICKLDYEDINLRISDYDEEAFEDIKKYDIYVEQLDKYIFLSKESFETLKNKIEVVYNKKLDIFTGAISIGLSGKYSFTGKDYYYNYEKKNIDLSVCFSDGSKEEKIYCIDSKKSKCIDNEWADLKDICSEIYADYSYTSKSAVLKVYDDKYTYNDFGDMVEIVKYYGKEDNVVIPSQIDGKPVRYIANGAFASNIYLSSVTIPDTVVEIGYEAFYYCKKLLEVKGGEGLKAIGGAAFSECELLNEFKLPDTVVMIGKEAFKDTMWYYKIYSNAIDEDEVCIYLGMILYEYIGTENEDITEVIVDASTLSICEGVFENCVSIKSIYLPESLRYIGNNAFSNMVKLESINLPKKLEYIGESAFYACKKLERITVPGSIKIIESGLFSECTNLRYVEIGEGTKVIQSNVFSMNDNLEGVLIPDSVLFMNETMFVNGYKSIIGNSNSYAMTYASNMGIEFLENKIQ